MAKTTVYIALTIGPQLPAYPAYVAFRSPYRFVAGSTLVLPEPSPVALSPEGTATVAVDPGVWLVDEILPTQVIRRAVVVPATAGVVQYTQLTEVSSPVEIGYGPTWAQTALQAAGDAQAAAALALTKANEIEAAIDQALAAAAAIPDNNDQITSALLAAGSSLTREAFRAATRESTGLVPLRDFGADPSGGTPADAAMALALAEIDPGMDIVLDGNFLFNDAIVVNGKSVGVRQWGGTVTRGNLANTTNKSLIEVTGGHGSINAVTSIAVTPAAPGAPLVTILTLPAAPIDLTVGDIVGVVSDEYAPASRTGTARNRWDGTVVAIDGYNVTVYGGPYDACTNNIRVARLKYGTFSWDGGDGQVTRASEFVTPASVGGALFSIRDVVSPRLLNINIPLTSGAGISLSGVLGAQIENFESHLLRDTYSDTGTSGGVLGYAVLASQSLGTSFRHGRVFGGRHAFSTAQASPAAGGDALSTVMRAFGVEEHASVHDVIARGTYVSAFDTHEAARGVTFDDCVAIGSGYAGFGLRGRDHSITGDSRAELCNIGVTIFDDAFGGESYGHRLIGLLIDRPRLNGILVDVHRQAGHPAAGNRQAGVTAFVADGVVMRGLKGSPIRVINGRSVARGDITIVWDSTPDSADAGDIELTNSELRGLSILSDRTAITGPAPSGIYVPTAGDTSIVELEAYRIVGAQAQLDRVVRSASSSAVVLLPNVLLDDDPSNTADIQAAAGSVFDFRTLTGKTDSSRMAVTASTADLSRLARSLKPNLVIQASISLAKTLPALPAGRVRGQLLYILNPPNLTNGSSANLTVQHGTTPKTYLAAAADKVLAPGQAITLMWHDTLGGGATPGRWVEIP